MYPRLRESSDYTAIVNADSNSQVVVRGVNGTAATAHPTGSLLTIRPPFSRRSVYEAVAQSITQLYPRLHRRRALPITILRGHTPIPADAELPESFTWIEQGDVYRSRIQVIDLFDATTGKALLALDAPVGTSGTLVYRGRFVRPASEVDRLVEDLGVMPEYETAVQVKALSHLVAGRDISNMTTEYLTRKLESQLGDEAAGFGTRLRESLIRYYEYLMADLTRSSEAVMFTNGWAR